MTKIVRPNTTQGNRPQTATIAATDLAIGSDAIGFAKGFTSRIFLDVAISVIADRKRSLSGLH